MKQLDHEMLNVVREALSTSTHERAGELIDRLNAREDEQSGITEYRIKTKGGHELRVFFNVAKNLLVVDLNHSKRAGGNEIVRMHLDERKLLKHCAKLPKWEDA